MRFMCAYGHRIFPYPFLATLQWTISAIGWRGRDGQTKSRARTGSTAWT